MKNTILFGILLCGFSVVAQSLDSSFGDAGSVIYSLADLNENTTAVVVQPDGKIVTGGSTLGLTVNTFTLSRHLPDGSLDTEFGNNGHAATAIGHHFDGIRNTLALQPDGKILLAGTVNVAGGWDFAVTRFNANGTVDTDFGQNGVANIDFYGQRDSAMGIVVQQDHKILVCGIARWAEEQGDIGIVRLLPDGMPDPSFGTDGKVALNLGLNVLGQASNDAAMDLLIPENGQIIVGGYTNAGTSGISTYDFALIRINAGGTLDQTFGTDGIVQTDFGESDNILSMVMTSDNKVVASGISFFSGGIKLALSKYNQDGQLDDAFGTDGKVSLQVNSEQARDLSSEIVVRDSGGLICSGASRSADGLNDALLVSFHADGTLDTDFGVNGAIIANFNGGNTRFSSLALQPDGKLVCVGTTNDDSILARYDLPTLSALHFETKSVEVYPNPFKEILYVRNAQNQTALRYELYDSVGRKITAFEAEKFAMDNDTVAINTNFLSKGTYLLSITNGQMTQTVKVVK